MIEQAVVLAAGHGIPLGPHTRSRPRAMLPALGKPLVVRVMERLREAGVVEFVVVLGEEEGEVAAYLNHSWYVDAEVAFSLQSASSSLSEALLQAAYYLTGPFLLLSADTLTPPGFLTQLRQQFAMSTKDVVVSLVQARYAQTGGLVAVDIEGDQVVSLFPGEDHSQAHEFAAFTACACSTEVLSHFTEQRSSLSSGSDIATLLQSLLRNGHTIGYLLADWCFTVREENDLLKLHEYLFDEERDTHILSELPTSVRITPPVRIDPKVSVGQNAHIGPNVYLEAGCVVGRGARISHTVVLSDGIIPANTRLDHALVFSGSSG